MKDTQEKHKTMATTTLERIPLTFTPIFGFGHQPSTLRNPSYPDHNHTDWGPRSRNRDELAAALAMAQLSPYRLSISPQTQHVVTTNAPMMRMPARAQSKSPQEGTGSAKWDAKANVMKYSGEAVAIKSESTNDDHKYVDSNESRLVARNPVATEGGHYVRTCQHADIDRRDVNKLSVASSDRSARRQSPNTTAMNSAEQYHYGLSSYWETDKASTRENIERNLDRKPALQSLDNNRHFNQFLSSSTARSAEREMNVKNSSNEMGNEIKASEIMNYRYSAQSRRRTPPNSLEIDVASRLREVGEVQPRQRFDSPTGLLKRKAQLNIEQARRRNLSDNSGLVRHRILEGKFGSLSAIAAYYKQLDKFDRSRLPLDDSAIDLSIRKQKVNKRRLSDDATNAPRTNSGTHMDRETPELTVAFRRCELRSIQPPAIDSCITTQQRSSSLRQSISVPHSLCDLDNSCTDITVPGTIPQAIITQYKSADDIHSELLRKENEANLKLQITCLSSDDRRRLRVDEDAISCRKSRSPTFQLPDCQLPPKKRRLLGHCIDEMENLKQEEAEIEKIQEKGVTNNGPESVKYSSQYVGVADNNHVIDNHSSNDNLLSAVRPDEDGDLPIHIAVARGMTSIVERLLYVMKRLNFSIDTRNNQKQTPLHLAIITNQPDVVDLLLDSGALLSLTDRHGDGVAHLAVRYNSAPCLDVILDRQRRESVRCSSDSIKVDLDARNFEGLTALQMAVQRGNFEGLEQLLRAGADVNAQEGKNGRTALYLAVELNNIRAAQLLIDHGADCSLLSYSGCSLIQAAAGLGHLELVQLLETYLTVSR